MLSTRILLGERLDDGFVGEPERASHGVCGKLVSLYDEIMYIDRVGI